MNDDHNLDGFELGIVSLSILSIVVVLIQMLDIVDSESSKLLGFIDVTCCSIFIIEWIVRFFRSKSKLKFTYKNIIDLIGSVPIYLFITNHWIILIRFFKIFGSISRLRTYVLNNTKMNKTRTLLAVLMMFILFISPLIILNLEKNYGAINTAENALWWTFCTITTIGYGDLYPVTTLGRLFTVFVSLGGIGVFGIITSIFINNTLQINEKSKNQS